MMWVMVCITVVEFSDMVEIGSLILLFST